MPGIKNGPLKPVRRLFSPVLSVKGSKLTAGEITRLSWSHAIETEEDIPAFFKEAFRTLAGQAGRGPYSVFVPAYGGLLSRSYGKLLCNLDRQVYIFERERNQAVVTCYDADGISYSVFGRVLLYGWITIRGISGAGLLTSSTIAFNAVNEKLFLPFLEKIRRAENCDCNCERAGQLRQLDYLNSLNYKFMNYAKGCLLPGERVVDSLLQPEIRARIANLFGHSIFHTLSTAHLLILTDRELIVLSDEAFEVVRKGRKYGGIWTFIPLSKISSLQVIEGDDRLLTLSVHLPGNEQLDWLFSSLLRRELDRFMETFDSLAAGVAHSGIEAGS